MPTMELISAIVSSVLGFFAGLISSYIFWYKQRKLDRPRLSFELAEDIEVGQGMRFILRNKGGSFAERLTYSFSQYHDVGKVGEVQMVHFDDALAPAEIFNLVLEIDPEHDAMIVFDYLDVFGKKYQDAWDIHYDGALEGFLVVRRDEED